jgi:preprotein translocase subunit YajC
MTLIFIIFFFIFTIFAIENSLKRQKKYKKLIYK